MVDRIFIDNMRLKCKIGVTADERREPQDVIVDVSLILDLDRAATSNSLDDTVNYREIMQQVSAFVLSGEFTLLEGLAEGIATLALSSFQVERVSVRVRKGKYANEPSVGVEIERAAKAGGQAWSRQ